MRGSELTWLAFGIENARRQEGKRMRSPPRHHEFGEKEKEETTGECSKNCAHNSVQRKKREENREEG